MIKLKRLTFKDKKNIQEFTGQFYPYSDFNFTSLWCYNIENDVEYFLDKNVFVIRLRDYLTNKPIYSFLSKNSTSELVNNLLTIAGSEGVEKKLRLVPEQSVNKKVLSNPDLIVKADRNNFDYITSTKITSSLMGRNFIHKRHHLSQFRKFNSGCLLKISNGKSKNEKTQIMKLFDKWATKKNSDSAHERVALYRLLKFIDKLTITLIGLWDKDELVGFVLDEKLGRYALGHFMKADISYKHIYDMLFFQAVKHWYKSGCQYLNYEQDLGLEGLRKTKLSWHPAKFLKKYVISAR